MTADADTSAVSQPFQAEVAELLHLMVHSVYSETDIFLRELISNASDACDRLRYEAIAAPDLIADGATPKIRIVPDKKADTLSVIDSGIGMDRQELIDNLGTIARSGTKSFLSRLTEAKDGVGLIGQFGVGFYAAFMVADRIVVTSRRAGTDQVWVWSSSGGSGFEIAPASEEDARRVTRGTEIALHLKPDARKYLESYEIERIVGAYSDNIQFPIELQPEEGEPRQINSASALWQRSKSELTAEDYKQAYRAIAGAFDDPAMTLHYRAEGRQSYAVLAVRAVDQTARSVRAGPQGQGQALRSARVHCRRRRAVAGLSAVHSRRDRQRGSSAQYLARDAAEQPAARADPQGRHRPRDLRAGKPEREGAGGVRQDLGRVRSGHQGGIVGGPRTAREIAGAGAVHHHLGRKPLAEAVCRGPQAEPDRDLLSDRREPRAAEIEPEARIGDGAGHRGAADDRSGRCVLDLGAAGFRRQAAQIAEPGRRRFRPDPAAGREIRRSGAARRG